MKVQEAVLVTLDMVLDRAMVADANTKLVMVLVTVQVMDLALETAINL